MKKIIDFSCHSKAVRLLTFNQDGKLLSTIGYDDTIRLWSLSGKQELIRFDGDGYKAIGFNPSGELFAAGVSGRGINIDRLIVANVSKKKIVASFNLGSKDYPFSSDPPKSMVFNPRCNLVAAIYGCIEVVRPYKGGDIFLWQLNKKLLGYSLKEVVNMCGGVSHYRSPLLAFNPDGNILVTTQPVMVERSTPGKQWVGVVELWNVQNGKLIDMIEIPDLLGIKSIHFNSDNNIFLGTELSGLQSFHLWDKKRNKVVTIEHSAKVLSSAISPDGRFLATGDGTGIVKLSSIPDGQEIAVIEAESHNYGVGCIAFSPDGKTLALSADKIELWEV